MARISLLLSDVDGTLVTSGKVLTPRSRAAVQRLHENGIGFSIVSSRPPFGLRMLVEPLALKLPFGAYNGGALVRPDLGIIEQKLLPPEIVRTAIDLLEAQGVNIWLYSGDEWLVADPAGPYVDHELRTIQTPPMAVDDFAPYLASAGKLVGVSSDFARLDACQSAATKALSANATLSRSQRYYLDMLPLSVDKGALLETLSRRLAIPPAEIATIGDMENDLAMFRKGGFSIAMGNGSPEVKRLGDALTLSNDEDGFAHAIETLILPRGLRNSR